MVACQHVVKDELVVSPEEREKGKTTRILLGKTLRSQKERCGEDCLFETVRSGLIVKEQT